MLTVGPTAQYSSIQSAISAAITAGSTLSAPYTILNVGSLLGYPITPAVKLLNYPSMRRDTPCMQRLVPNTQDADVRIAISTDT